METTDSSSTLGSSRSESSHEEIYLDPTCKTDFIDFEPLPDGGCRIGDSTLCASTENLFKWAKSHGESARSPIDQNKTIKAARVRELCSRPRQAPVVYNPVATFVKLQTARAQEDARDTSASIAPEEIKLKPQQLAVVRTALFRSCLRPDSGMLLYHFMGTGKSLTAIAAAANFASTVKNIYVVCPQRIKFVWQLELDKWNPPFKALLLNFQDFTDMPADSFRNDCVILDEIQNVMTGPLMMPALSRLSSARLRFALSGTPADSVQGFLMLMRAVAPLKFPSTLEATLKKFTVIDPLRRALRVINHYLPWMVAALHPVLAFYRGSSNVIGPVHMAGSALMLFMLACSVTPKAASWNIPQVAEAASDIVSFQGDPAGSAEGEGFPEKNEDVVEVPLTNEQLDLFDQWVAQTIDPRILVDLGVVASVEELMFTEAKDRSSIDVILNKGRGMGMAGARPPKLKKIDKLLSEGKRTMIFTTFSGAVGLAGLEGHLKRRSHAYAVVSVNNAEKENRSNLAKYNNLKVDILLNYGIAEGMSLKETGLVVFLEPPPTSPMYMQVMARARRADSHNHLPPDKRVVSVVTLVSHFGEATVIQTKMQSVLAMYSPGPTLGFFQTRGIMELIIHDEYTKETDARLTNEEALRHTNMVMGLGQGALMAAAGWGLMLAAALTTPRNSIRQVLRWIANTSGSVSAERAALELSDNVQFDASKGAPEDLAWYRIKAGSKDLDALGDLLAISNVQTEAEEEGTEPCKSSCVPWPAHSASSKASSCTKRVISV